MLTLEYINLCFCLRKDHKEALEFLEKLREKTKASDEATILCSTSMGNIHLLQHDYAQTKVSFIKNKFKQSNKILATLKKA